MEQYIPKSALVAEIERRREESWLGHYTKEKGIIFDITDDILSFIDTLEVKEVDLDEETQRILDKHFFYPEEENELKEIPKLVRYVAKHFFELGLKVTNSLTWQDIFIIRRLIYEYDKEIKMKSNIKYPLREEFCTEVLKRFKELKEELARINIIF